MRAKRQPGPHPLVKGGIAADQDRLLHDNTYASRPLYYVDIRFSCVDCGTFETWTAEQQKWWSEVALGKIASRQSVRRLSLQATCAPITRAAYSHRRLDRQGWYCRDGIAETATRLKISIDDLERMRALGG